MLEHELLETFVVESPEQAMTLMNPLRAEILANLREPSSAAEVARNINDTPQRINYHLKTLEKVGLVRKTGTRQVRNLVEVLYQAIARTFILPESLGWGQEQVQRIKDQSSLMHLIHTADRIKSDALQWMDQVDEKEHVPSASLQMQVHLAGEGERNAFVQEYVDLVKKLAEKYQITQSKDNSYNVVLAVYPEINRREG